MQINILAGGPTAYWPDNMFEMPGEWLGVDRGAWYLLQHHIPMVQAIGDFDSLSDDEYRDLAQKVACHRLPCVKDETELEVAISRAWEYKPDRIVIYGATGGRLDHSLSALFLLAQPSRAAYRDRIVICDRQQWCTFLPQGHSQIAKQPGKTTLAFMAMTAVTDFTIHDAEYQLHHWSGQTPTVWSSNTFLTNHVTLDLGSGTVLVIQTNDSA